MRDLTSLTPEFWERVFGVGVVAWEPSRIGEGMIGANYRVALAARNHDVPSSVVVKLPSPGEESRAAGMAHRTYEREAKFYMHLADTPGPNTCSQKAGVNDERSRTATN